MEEPRESYREKIISNIREINKNERNLKRENMVNKRRGILGDVSLGSGVLVSIQQVNDIADKIKHKGLVNEHDLKTLTCAFIQNEVNIVEFSRNGAALHSLVRELTGVNSLTRLIATQCIVNLSLGNDKCCFKLAKLATPYLIANSQGMCVDLQVASIWAMGNLSGSDLKTWRLLQSQGLLKLLLELLPVLDLQETVVYTLTHYIKTGFNQIEYADFTSITSSVINVENNSPEVMWLLYLISCFNISDIDLSVQLVNRCLKVLNSSAKLNVKMLTATIRILANVVSEVSGNCAEYVVEKFDEIFINTFAYANLDVSDPRRLHLIGEFSWLIGNLMNHPSPIVQQRICLFDEKINQLNSLFKTVNHIYG